MASDNGGYYSYLPGNQDYSASYGAVPPTSDFSSNSDTAGYGFGAQSLPQNAPVYASDYSSQQTVQTVGYASAANSEYYDAVNAPSMESAQSGYGTIGASSQGGGLGEPIFSSMNTSQVADTENTEYSDAYTQNSSNAAATAAFMTGAGTQQNRQGTVYGRGRGRGGRGGSYGRGGSIGNTGTYSTLKPKAPKDPRNSESYYCEGCKVNCVGYQQYTAHLEGKQHKKKEKAAAALTAFSASGSVVLPAKGSNVNGFCCVLCSVSCSGPDVLRAHLQGAKHLKMLKLQEAQRKANEQTVTPSAAAAAVHGSSSAPVNHPPAAPVASSTQQSSGTGFVVKQPAAFAAKLPPKVAGGNVSLTTTDANQPPLAAATADSTDDLSVEQMEMDKAMAKTHKVTSEPIVGEDYLEALTSESGCVVSYHCKLCECTFTCAAAKDDHLRGRRHRLTYKKKVDPTVRVDMQPSRTSRLREAKEKQLQLKEAHWRQMDAIAFRMDQQQQMQMEEGSFVDPHMWWGPMPPPMPVMFHGDFSPMFHRHPPALLPRRTLDDKYMNMKHTQICLKEGISRSMGILVQACEKALLAVANVIAAEDEQVMKTTMEAKADATFKTDELVAAPAEADVTGDVEPSDDKEAHVVKQSDIPGNTDSRMLRGLMRVGAYRKNLMIENDNTAELVLLCRDIPTQALFDRIVGHLAVELPKVAGTEKYVIEILPSEASIFVSREEEPLLSVTVTLTSPAVRSIDAASCVSTDDVPEALNKEKCLQALAEIRRAKWFRVRCQDFRSAIIVGRILRDLSRRVVCWSMLSEWAQELITEKCICYVGFNAGPSEVLRTVFACIASGILLPGGSGLYDPCEKEPTDVTGDLTSQQLEDITAYAQMALRMIIYRQIYKLLGVEQLPKIVARPGQKRLKDDSGDKAGNTVEEDKAHEKRLKEDTETAMKIEIPVKQEITQTE